MAKEIWIVAGLGNPGENYRYTRHNVGFRVVEALALKHDARLKEKGKAIFGSVGIFDKEVVLFFPQTFMNASGEVLGPYVHYHQIPPDRVLVVSDDLDLPVGRTRLKTSGGSGGHHGLDSVIAHLGTKEFPRLRMGVGKPPTAGEGPDHVLSGFKPEEKPLIDAAILRAREGVEIFLEKGADAAMRELNKDVEA
jgi:PTH1 family peptidyl-tRNA hydrolase